MWTPESFRTKIIVIVLVTATTLAVHYGWLVEPIFGHVHWLHAVHGRFCYIPIVIAASWFGLRGGLAVAAVISILILPYVFGLTGAPRDLATELGEIVFYFAIATLIGVLVEREFKARRKQQEAQLRMERSQKLALVGQLAAGVAHEIKNPLASIKGAADILTADDTPPEDREEFKGILKNEVRRIDSTVAEFLEFARPKETKLERLVLSDTVRATVRQVEANAKRLGITVDTHLQTGVVVNGDPEKLHQMTLNLVLNAVQASHEGDTVRLDLSARHGSGARLAVTDSGEGIHEENLKRVFEPFFTTKSSGTGLGLAVVKDVVDGHGGRISIESRKGHGTTVTVVLPATVQSGSTGEDIAGGR